MPSKSRVLYVGVTGFLMGRVLHKGGEGGAFTRKYRMHRPGLLSCVSECRRRDYAGETEIKEGRREKKVALIREGNPNWEDLAAGWGKMAVMWCLEKQVPHRAKRPVRNDKGVG
jgi:predicted GIY-YIG superfamily endonuclease